MVGGQEEDDWRTEKGWLEDKKKWVGGQEEDRKATVQKTTEFYDNYCCSTNNFFPSQFSLDNPFKSSRAKIREITPVYYLYYDTILTHLHFLFLFPREIHEYFGKNVFTVPLF